MGLPNPGTVCTHWCFECWYEGVGFTACGFHQGQVFCTVRLQMTLSLGKSRPSFHSRTYTEVMHRAVVCGLGVGGMEECG